MINVETITLDGNTYIAIDVTLPKTNLVSIQTTGGYIMCGALDVDLLNTRLAARNIIAARAVGVKTFEQLLAAPLESVTDAAKELGVSVGMSGREALRKMAEL